MRRVKRSTTTRRRKLTGRGSNLKPFLSGVWNLGKNSLNLLRKINPSDDALNNGLSMINSGISGINSLLGSGRRKRVTRKRITRRRLTGRGIHVNWGGVSKDLGIGVRKTMDLLFGDGRKRKTTRKRRVLRGRSYKPRLIAKPRVRLLGGRKRRVTRRRVMRGGDSNRKNTWGYRIKSWIQRKIVDPLINKHLPKDWVQLYLPGMEGDY